MSGCLSPLYLNWISFKHSLEVVVDSRTSMVEDKALTMEEVVMFHSSMVVEVLATSNTSTSIQR